MGNVIGAGRRPLAALLGIGLIGALALGGSTAVSGADSAASSAAVSSAETSSAASAPREPKVVCVTSYQPPRGVYRYKPSKCEFHKRGEYPIAAYATASVKSMNWKRWGGSRASGKGKFVVNMVGPVPARVRLSKKREVCGLRVYTKLRITWEKPEAAGGGRDTFSIPITSCLH